MKRFSLLFVALLFSSSLLAQSAQSKQLQTAEIERIFTPTKKAALGIEYEIYRVYSYSDKSGSYYFVMTENAYSGINNEVKNDALKGFCIKNDFGQLSNLWSLRDFKKKKSADEGGENSIWFWSKYCSFSDLDGDGLIEPVIVYGTSGINGTGDGRIKILTYYKGVKKAIRHQNGTLDNERNTQVDASFYKLPMAIQKGVRNMMMKITENDHGIFPAGWESAMDQHKGFFDEN